TAQVRGRRVGDVRFDGLFGRRLGYLAGALIQRAFCPPKPAEVKALQEPDALVSKRGKPRAPAIRQRPTLRTYLAAMSLVASTGGVTLFPLYVQNMLTPNVVARALEGKSPAIDLMLGCNKANSSPLLKQFLSRADE